MMYFINRGVPIFVNFNIMDPTGPHNFRTPVDPMGPYNFCNLNCLLLNDLKALLNSCFVSVNLCSVGRNLPPLGVYRSVNGLI